MPMDFMDPSTLPRCLLSGRSPHPALRQSLAAHGFDAQFSGDSAILVSQLLKALVSERAKTAFLTKDMRRQEQALWAAEQAAPGLRAEVGRLVRDNAQLHHALIEEKEKVEALRRGEGEELSRARTEVRDLAFVCSTLRHRADELEVENAGLREMASRSFELNGIVLPSGHEVRWHGRKERMEAHSPVAPAGATRARVPPPSASPSNADGAASALVPAAVPARLVRAAEGQLTALLARVGLAEGRVGELEAALAEAQQQLVARDEALRRTGVELARAREAGSDADERRCEREAASMAIAQLSSQVDFVNARCADLERSVRTQTAVETIVRLDEEERLRLLTAVSDLRRSQRLLEEQLEQAAAAGVVLATVRPDARQPFGA